MQDLIQKSITAALKQQWQKAIELNQQILKDSPQDIPTLNRLAKAYKEVGNKDEAINHYEQVLAIDKHNEIAKKNLELLNKTDRLNNNCQEKLVTNFIDDPGKTKTLSLVKLGNADVIETLQYGQPVKLIVKSRGIAVTSSDDTYIGSLTDDISYHLKHFLEAGCQFESAIRSNSNKKVQVFIRETFRSPEMKLQSPFSE